MTTNTCGAWTGIEAPQRSIHGSGTRAAVLREDTTPAGLPQLARPRHTSYYQRDTISLVLDQWTYTYFACSQCCLPRGLCGCTGSPVLPRDQLVRLGGGYGTTKL
jgi:hypothetical protein